MTTERASRRGRPVVADRALIDEAAAELFLERGYAETSVDEIARRAGVSRSSFFNCVPAKPDVLWGSVDAALDALEARLAEAGAGARAAGTALTAREIVEVLLGLAAEAGPEQVPWAIAHAELMGTRDALLASGAARAARAAEAIARALGGAPDRTLADRTLAARAFAAAATGALAAAGSLWIEAGRDRPPLAELLAPALAPLGGAWPELGRPRPGDSPPSAGG